MNTTENSVTDQVTDQGVVGEDFGGGLVGLVQRKLVQAANYVAGVDAVVHPVVSWVVGSVLMVGFVVPFTVLLLLWLACEECVGVVRRVFVRWFVVRRGDGGYLLVRS